MDKMGLTFFASTTAVEPFSLALETGDLLTVTLGALAALKRVVLLVVLVIEVEAGAAMVAAAGWIFFVPAALPPGTRNFYVLGGVGLGGCCGVLIGRAIWTRIKKSFPEMSHHIFPNFRILGNLSRGSDFPGEGAPPREQPGEHSTPFSLSNNHQDDGTAHVFFFKWIFSYTRPPLSTRAHPFASLMALTSSLAFLALNELCTLVAAALSSFIS